MKLTEQEEEELAADPGGGAAEDTEGYDTGIRSSAAVAAAGTPQSGSTGYEARALLNQVGESSCVYTHVRARAHTHTHTHPYTGDR